MSTFKSKLAKILNYFNFIKVSDPDPTWPKCSGFDRIDPDPQRSVYILLYLSQRVKKETLIFIGLVLSEFPWCAAIRV
jgi:hypothetical protein